jgi:D-alanyl-D-alanine endopeptidase (penicillin-binding protein 7)
MRELQKPLYKTGPLGELLPDVRAEAAIIYNPVTHEVLWESNAQNTRSIASITKVMTAVVFLEHAVDLAETVEILPVDVRAASTTYLRARDKVTANDLLHLLLIG